MGQKRFLMYHPQFLRIGTYNKWLYLLQGFSLPELAMGYGYPLSLGLVVEELTDVPDKLQLRILDNSDKIKKRHTIDITIHIIMVK